VDDDPFLLYATISSLKQFRLKIETANSGEEAMDKLLSYSGCKACSNYKLLVTDLIMGGMDGIALTV